MLAESSLRTHPGHDLWYCKDKESLLAGLSPKLTDEWYKGNFSGVAVFVRDARSLSQISQKN